MRREENRGGPFLVIAYVVCATVFILGALHFFFAPTRGFEAAIFWMGLAVGLGWFAEKIIGIYNYRLAVWFAKSRRTHKEKARAKKLARKQ